MSSKDRIETTSGLLLSELPEVHRPIGAHLMTLLGFLFVVAAPTLAVGPKYLPEIEPWAAAVQSWGIGLDVLACCGFALFGLGRLAAYQVKHTRTVLEPGLIEHDLEQVDAGLREMQSRIKELRDEDTLLRQEMLTIGKLVHELNQTQATVSADVRNALFRLAASLDQLGERVDQRVEAGTTAVGERIFEATGIIEASRDFLQECIEESAREVGGYIYEALELDAQVAQAQQPVAPAQPSSHAQPAEFAPQANFAPQAEFAPQSEVMPANPPSAAQPTQPSMPEPPPGPDDLVIEVELEDEPSASIADELHLDEVDPSEPTASDDDGGLGLLDQLDDPEAALPSDELDEYEDEGEHSSDEEEPEATREGPSLALSHEHPRAPQANVAGETPPSLGDGPKLRLVSMDEIEGSGPKLGPPPAQGL